MKLRNKNSLIPILTAIVMIMIFTPSVRAGAGKIEDMNFKGADIRDVLRIIAEVAETNLVIDGSVKGNITIHLTDITFAKALDMITASHHLEYKWDGNIIVVAPPERMQDIYGRVDTRIIEINDPELQQVKKITNEIYPELNIQINQRKSQLVIQGKVSMINKAVRLIDKIKYSEPETAVVQQDNSSKVDSVEEIPEIITEIKDVQPGNLNMIVENVRNIYPDLRVASNKNNYQVILHGQHDIIERAVDLIEQIDLPVEQEAEEETIITEIVKIKSRQAATILDNLKNIYDGLRLSQNNDLVIIKGEKENVKKALDLVEQLDVPVAGEKEIFNEDEIVTKVISVNRENTASIYNTVSSIYGELKLAQNQDTGQIVLHGEKEIVNKTVKLIEELDKPVTVDEENEGQNENQVQENPGNNNEAGKNDISYMEVVNLENSDLNKIKKEINAVKPDLQITTSEIYQQILIKGNKEDVLAAKSMALKYDKEQRVITRMVRVDYADIENIKSIVSSLYGEANLQLNNKVREIVIKGKEKDVDEAVSLIKELDITRQQVIIEARVEEISSTQLSEIGVNPNSFSRIHFIRENSGDSGSSGPITDIELTWPEFLDAMNREGSAETLANPHLMTLNGEEAKLLIGQRIPVKSENSSGETSIKYIEAGISLQFKPWITEDGSIELEIQPKVSSLGEELYAGYPSIKTREVDTRLRLQDGETFAIGGLIQEDVSESLAKVPILSEIPILGELFKNRDKETSKTELLIFITPRIVKETIQNEKNNTELNDQDNINGNMQSNEVDNKQKLDKKSKTNEITTRTEKISKIEFPEINHDIKDLSREELRQVLNKSRKTRDYTGEENLPLFLNILYEVPAGETLEEIASTYDVSLESIKFVNYLDQDVKEGDLITIPIPRDHLYRVQEGETLWRISQKMNVDIEKLVEINKIEDISNLPVGFIVIFPHSIR